MSSMERQSALTKGPSKRTRSRESQEQVTPDIRQVSVGGADYFIYWDQLNVGNSFFMPTLLSARDVMRDLRPIARKLKIQLEVRNRYEYGVYGARVWRVA